MVRNRHEVMSYVHDSPTTRQLSACQNILQKKTSLCFKIVWNTSVACVAQTGFPVVFLAFLSKNSIFGIFVQEFLQTCKETWILSGTNFPKPERVSLRSKQVAARQE